VLEHGGSSVTRVGRWCMHDIGVRSCKISTGVYFDSTKKSNPYAWTDTRYRVLIYSYSWTEKSLSLSHSHLNPWMRLLGPGLLRGARSPGPAFLRGARFSGPEYVARVSCSGPGFFPGFLGRFRVWISGYRSTRHTAVNVVLARWFMAGGIVMQ
jgi:hypothetical protein